jgi:hypothetical protein
MVRRVPVCGSGNLEDPGNLEDLEDPADLG